VSGVDPNGGGPLLVPGGASAPPEGTGLVSVTDGVLDTPSTLAARVAADAAALRAAMGVPGSVEVDPLTSTSGGLQPWTAVPVTGCTQSISGGLITLTTPSGQAGISGNDYLQYHRALGVETARGVDVSVRVASWSGTLGTRRANMVLSGRAVPLGTTPSTGEFAIWCAVSDADGRMVIGDYIGSTFTTRVDAAASQIPLDGTGLMRVIVSPTGYSVWTGVGASYAAAVWTRRASVAFTTTGAAAVMPEVTRVSLAGYRSASQAEAFVVAYSDFRVVGL
jgi:hypothetical protein